MNEVPSNECLESSGKISAVILFPSLGSPSLIARTEVDKKIIHHLHLVLLGPENLKEIDVANHLILDVPSAILALKRGEQPIDWRPLARNETDAKVVVEQMEIVPFDKPFEIAELHLKGLWAEQALMRYTKGADQNLSKEEDKIRKEDCEKFKVLYHVTINLIEALTFWACGDNASVRELVRSIMEEIPSDPSPIFPKYCFLLHWCDESLHVNNSCIAAPRSQNAFQRILTKTDFAHGTLGIAGSSKLFIGEKLAEFLKDGENGLKTLAFDSDAFDSNDEIHFSDYHPVFWYIKRKEHFDVGFISDLHHVTKFQILRNSPLRVNPDDLSLPTIGEQLLDTIETLNVHLQQMADDPLVDVIVIGGDLVDFHQDNFPTDDNGNLNVKALRKGASKDDIWNACKIESEHEDRKKNYQSGTSAVGLFRKIASIVLLSEKPVIMIAGNHDAYHEPFGISPRVGTQSMGEDSNPDSWEYTAANEGIPADCNLTIMEACVAFGKSYGWWSESSDFQKEVMELFYLLYSPFRTWTFQMGALQQFLVLDWGDSEEMFWDQEGLPGHLPHADSAFSDDDINVVQYAAKQANPSTQARVSVFSHATFACYSPDTVINPNGTGNEHEFSRNDSTGILGGTDTTNYNYGTFAKKRSEIFALIEKPNHSGISFCLSGHAHRAAAYQVVSAAGASKIRVKGFHFEELQQWDKSHCLLAVSDSAGPIPRDNRNDGLLGWGSRPSAWTRVKYGADGLVECLTSVALNPSQVANAKPRVAVALDYLESTKIIGDKGLLPKTFFNGVETIDVAPGLISGDDQNEKYRSLWLVTNASHIPKNRSQYIMSLDDGTQYYSLGPSNAVSDLINEDWFIAKSPLYFRFHESVYPLPQGVFYEKAELSGYLKTKSKTLVNCIFQHNKGPGYWELAIAEILKDIATDEDSPSLYKLITRIQEKPVFGVGWLKLYFTGNSEIYDIRNPWIVSVFIVLQPEKNGNRILLVRNSRGMEQPTHDSY